MQKPNTSELLFDKGIDFLLMFLGLWAAMLAQDCADHQRDKQQYVKLLEGFQEELENNRDQRSVIESKLGDLSEDKSIGEAAESFDYFSAQAQYMRSFLPCYVDIRSRGVRGVRTLSAERKAECRKALKQSKPKQATHLDLSPVYRRDVWRLYLADGVGLFREFESTSAYPRCEIEGKPTKLLAICIGSVYRELSEVERQVSAIQELVNETYFFRQGALDAEMRALTRTMKSLGKPKSVQDVTRLKTLTTDFLTKLNQDEMIVKISRAQMRYKIRQLKQTALELERDIGQAVKALKLEIGTEDAQELSAEPLN